ncbi:MAG TPA: hypothetical protein VNU01_11210, partial [Egibacteraceae bacterium]|nr:hypothetical protein [Egibacteraceae bacterium]
MSLRTRVALIAATAVAVSVLAVSVGAYLATARTLHGGVDASLLDQAEQLLGLGGRPRMGPR